MTVLPLHHPNSPLKPQKSIDSKLSQTLSVGNTSEIKFFEHPDDSQDSVALAKSQVTPASGEKHQSLQPILTYAQAAIETLPSGHRMHTSKEQWIIDSQLDPHVFYQKRREYATTEIYPDNQGKAHQVFGRWRNIITQWTHALVQQRRINDDILHAEREWPLPSQSIRLNALQRMKESADLAVPKRTTLNDTEKAIINSQHSVANPLQYTEMAIQRQFLDTANSGMAELENKHFQYSAIHNRRVEEAQTTLTQRLDETLAAAGRLGEKLQTKKKVPTRQAEQTLANAYAILRSRESQVKGYTGWGEGLNPFNSSLAKNSTRAKRTALPVFLNRPEKPTKKRKS